MRRALAGSGSEAERRWARLVWESQGHEAFLCGRGAKEHAGDKGGSAEEAAGSAVVGVFAKLDELEVLLRCGQIDEANAAKTGTGRERQAQAALITPPTPLQRNFEQGGSRLGFAVSVDVLDDVDEVWALAFRRRCRERERERDARFTFTGSRLASFLCLSFGPTG
jgi:hypothetical protein